MESLYKVEDSEHGFAIIEKANGETICVCPDVLKVAEVVKALEVFARTKEIKILV